MLHPVAARMRGFDTGGETRTAGGKRPFGLRFADRMGTVPGLKAGDRRISTNHGIARFLDEEHPEPPLFPADPDERAAVEEAERWANDTLQMAARRIPGAAIRRDPEKFARSAGEGRLGHLLYRHERTRRVMIPDLARSIFATSANPERDPAQELPALLDRIDGWIGEGSARRTGAQRGGLHGGAQPGADPLPGRRDADVRGPAGAGARGSRASRAGVGLSSAR